MTQETKSRSSALTWTGFGLAIALGIGWYVDRSKLGEDLEKARSDEAEAVAELASAQEAPRPTIFPAEPAPAPADPAPAPAGPQADEVASARSELTKVREELTSTRQALSDSDDVRTEVGQKLQACQASLNELQLRQQK